MEAAYIIEKTFENIDFTVKGLTRVDYEACSFINCNFADTDLSNISFIESEFSGCNLSTAKLVKTGFKDVRFKDCKLLGLHFDYCDSFLFEVNFENCTLNLSSFYQVKLKKTNFKNCILHEVDFVEADLSNSIFDQCDLNKAVFENTNLEKADLLTAYNYSFDPELNRIKKAKFSVPAVTGLLHKYDIDIKL
jgi:uncharacterized protein YjbI with pentapeptide repeats